MSPVHLIDGGPILFCEIDRRACARYVELHASRAAALARVAELERERDELLQHERDVAHACGVEHVWDYGSAPGPRKEVIDQIEQWAEKEREGWESDLFGEAIAEAGRDLDRVSDHLALTRRRALLLGSSRRRLVRMVAGTAAAVGMYHQQAIRWRRACLAACKHAKEWRAEAVDYMVTGAKDWGVEHKRAKRAEAERDRLREVLTELVKANDAHDARGSLGTARAIQACADRARAALAGGEGKGGEK